MIVPQLRASLLAPPVQSLVALWPGLNQTVNQAGPLIKESSQPVSVYHSTAKAFSVELVVHHHRIDIHDGRDQLHDRKHVAAWNVSSIIPRGIELHWLFPLCL